MTTLPDETKENDRDDPAGERLIVAISSSALFDMADSDAVFRNQGVAAYARYQVAHEDVPLDPGDAFGLVRKLLRLGELTGGDRVEVILLSRNTADTGLRVFNSIQHHDLAITRAAFTGGSPPYRYMRAFGSQLFLSTNAGDVRAALEAGEAAATIFAGPRGAGPVDDTLRIAFDGDAVLFSDEAERIYATEGLGAFARSEAAAALTPLAGGPFKPFLTALHALQVALPEGDPLIRTALVTARSAPAHERVVHTLREWGIRLDESLFLGGLQKTEFLTAFAADVFFDDREEHCSAASGLVATGHVPHGVRNE